MTSPSQYFPFSQLLTYSLTIVSRRNSIMLNPYISMDFISLINASVWSRSFNGPFAITWGRRQWRNAPSLSFPCPRGGHSRTHGEGTRCSTAGGKAAQDIAGTLIPQAGLANRSAGILTTGKAERGYGGASPPVQSSPRSLPEGASLPGLGNPPWKRGFQPGGTVLASSWGEPRLRRCFTEAEPELAQTQTSPGRHQSPCYPAPLPVCAQRPRGGRCAEGDAE